MANRDLPDELNNITAHLASIEGLLRAVVVYAVMVANPALGKELINGLRAGDDITVPADMNHIVPLVKVHMRLIADKIERASEELGIGTVVN